MKNYFMTHYMHSSSFVIDADKKKFIERRFIEFLVYKK